MPLRHAPTCSRRMCSPRTPAKVRAPARRTDARRGRGTGPATKGDGGGHRAGAHAGQTTAATGAPGGASRHASRGASTTGGARAQEGRGPRPERAPSQGRSSANASRALMGPTRRRRSLPEDRSRALSRTGRAPAEPDPGSSTGRAAIAAQVDPDGRFAMSRAGSRIAFRYRYLRPGKGPRGNELSRSPRICAGHLEKAESKPFPVPSRPPPAGQ